MRRDCARAHSKASAASRRAKIAARRERFNPSIRAIERPRTVVVVWLLVALAGAFAFSKLRYSLLPDIALPVVVAIATDANSSASAARTELELTRPIERALAQTQPASLASTTYPGRVVVRLTYDFGNALDAHAAAVRAALARAAVPKLRDVRFVPIDLNESAVDTFVIPFGDDAGRRVMTLAQVRASLVPAFERIPGVKSATLFGDDPKRSVARYAGAPVFEIRVVKRGGANALEIDRLARAVSRSFETRTPLRVLLANSQAPYVDEASHATLDALAVAMLLAALVTFPFLRDARATLIAALAIPCSLAGAVLAMAAFRLNLEMITLLALALVTGVIVDDAIVDIENIVRRLDAGESVQAAARNGTSEIWRAVSAATLSIVAVFLPIGLTGGNVGQFFKPFGLVASAAVITSLLVARTLTPALAVTLLRRKPRHAAEEIEKRKPFDALALYSRALTFAIRRPGATLALAGLGVSSGIAIVPLIPQGFIPHLERGDFVVYLTSPLGTSLAESAAHARKLEDAIAHDPDVASVLTTLGDRDDPTRGVLVVALGATRKVATLAIEDRVRASLPAIDGYAIDVEDTPLVDRGLTKRVRVILSGNDRVAVDRAARALLESLQSKGGYRDLGVRKSSDELGVLVRIERFARGYAAYVDADLDGRSIGEATAIAVRAAHSIAPQLDIHLAGESASSTNTLRGFGITLGFSIVAVLAVLIALFRRVRPIAIVALALPLSLLGATVALALTRTDFGIISLLGLIFLLGLGAKNAILLVDAVERRLRAGNELEFAIRESAQTRARPIAMTTAATILGMLPIALGIGAGSELRAPMAIAIIGGLITSTVFTLVAVPAAYALGIPSGFRGSAERRARTATE